GPLRSRSRPRRSNRAVASCQLSVASKSPEWTKQRGHKPMTEKSAAPKKGSHAGLGPLEAALGHKFNRIHLLEQALTHSSHAHELQDEEASLDNEQLEFL